MHKSQYQQHITPLEDPLYVVCAIDNPEMYSARYRHYHAFEKHIEDSGAVLYTVEVAVGGRHFEVTQAGHPRHIQLRAKTDLWRKENLQNIGVAHLPHDFKHVALCDADFLNTRPDWVQATVQALQRYDAVQMFSTYSCLKADFTVESVNDGFVYAWGKGRKDGKPVRYDAIHGAPGGQWAYNRKGWDALEGMLQTPILGSADWYMTYALLGLHDDVREKELLNCAPRYIETINEWCNRAWAALKGNVWYLENHGIHYWHGPIVARGYGWRWKILGTHAFEPISDLKTELSGLLELRGNKPGMRDEIRAYLRSRKEDAI